MLNYYLQQEERKRNLLAQPNEVFIPQSWHSTRYILKTNDQIQYPNYVKYADSEFKHTKLIDSQYEPSHMTSPYSASKKISQKYHLSDTRTKSDNSYMIESFSNQMEQTYQDSQKKTINEDRGYNQNQSISPRFQIPEEISKQCFKKNYIHKEKKQNQRKAIFEPLQKRQVERSLLDELSKSYVKESFSEDSPQKNSLIDELLSKSHEKENSSLNQFQISAQKQGEKSPKKAPSHQMQQKFVYDDMADSLIEPLTPQIKKHLNTVEQKITSEKASQFDCQYQNSSTQTTDRKQEPIRSINKDFAIQTDIMLEKPQQRSPLKDTQTQTLSIFSPLVPKSYQPIKQIKKQQVHYLPEKKQYEDKATITENEKKAIQQKKIPEQKSDYDVAQYQQQQKIQAQEKPSTIIEQSESVGSSQVEYFDEEEFESKNQCEKKQKDGNFYHEQIFSTFNPKNTEFSSTNSSHYDLIEGQIFNYVVPQHLQPTPTYMVPKKQWPKHHRQEEDNSYQVSKLQKREFSFENLDQKYDERNSKSPSRKKSRSPSRGLRKKSQEKCTKTYAEIFETLRKNKNPNKSVNRLTYSTNETQRYFLKSDESIENQEFCQRFLAHHHIKTFEEYDLKISKNPQNKLEKIYSPQKSGDKMNPKQAKTLLGIFKQKLSKV